MPSEKSEGLQDVHLYNHEKFKRAGRIHRLHIHMTDPDRFKLENHEQRLLVRLNEAWSLIKNIGVRGDAIDTIMAHFKCTRVQAGHYYEDTTELYGSMMNGDRDYERLFLRDKFYKLYEMAEAKGDIQEARQCLAMIAKLDGLDQKPGTTAPRAPEIPQPVFTNNPNALNSVSDDQEG